MKVVAGTIGEFSKGKRDEPIDFSGAYPTIIASWKAAEEGEELRILLERARAIGLDVVGRSVADVRRIVENFPRL